MQIPQPDLLVAWPIDISQTVAVLLDGIAFGDVSATTEPDNIFEQLGAASLELHMSLPDLVACIRIAFRVALKAVLTAVGESVADLRPEETVGLVEHLTDFTEAVVAATTRGYEHQRAEAGGGLSRQQREFGAQLLLASDSGRLHDAAEAAGWATDSFAVAVVADRSGAERISAIMGGRIGWAERSDDVIVGVEVSHGKVATHLRRKFAGIRCAVGPAFPIEEFPSSARMAGTAALTARHAHGPVFADDMLASIVCDADPQARAALRRKHLYPLDELPAEQRDMLLTTLRSWLLHWGRRPDVAKSLHVHPQTVSGRINRLRDLLSDDLDDPMTLVELQLALA